MAWRMSVVRDISHHNTIGNYTAFRAFAESVQIKITESTSFNDPMAAVHKDGCLGMQRAPYHFARPVSIPAQVAHFLDRKAYLGKWERPDMLDCEFPGITGAFINALKKEYRNQSGISRVQIYVGLHDIVTSCPPSQWWDEDVYMQVARYRKIGAPDNPDDWGNHLGFDHPGLATYQWDNASPFYPGGPVGDVSYDRVWVTNVLNQPEEYVSDYTIVGRTAADATVYVGNGVIRRKIPNTSEMNDIAYVTGHLDDFAGKVNTLGNLAVLGVDISTLIKDAVNEWLTNNPPTVTVDAEAIADAVWARARDDDPTTGPRS